MPLGNFRCTGSLQALNAAGYGDVDRFRLVCGEGLGRRLNLHREHRKPFCVIAIDNAAPFGPILHLSDDDHVLDPG
ncbi:MAG: hypothetical protein ACTII3_02185 [Galactobacter sp.]